jgi:hypothetical protein
LSHVRTNDGALGEGREFREFALDTSGQLRPGTLAHTPAPVFFDEKSEWNVVLASLVSSSIGKPGTRRGGSALLGFSLPRTVQSASDKVSTLAAHAMIYNNDETACWSSPSLKDPLGRHIVSKNTCVGCHAGETATVDCVHIQSRRAGEPSKLSAFLTDTTFKKFNDPVDPSVHYELSELPKRMTLFRSLFDDTVSSVAVIESKMTEMRRAARQH